MEIVFSQNALIDLDYWKQQRNDKILKKITQLISAIQTDPFRGIGKPEPLRYNHSGKWSRHITGEHRIIYKVGGGNIIIFSLRHHY